MKTLAQVLADYQEFHTKKITRIAPFISVPLIVFSVLVFLTWFSFSLNPFVTIPIIWPVIIAIAVYYSRLDKLMGIILGITFFIVGILIGAIDQFSYTSLSGKLFLLTFICGWIIQFGGHLFEHKKPGFKSNCMQVFVAPLFVMAEVITSLGKRKDLAQMLRSKSIPTEQTE